MAGDIQLAMSHVEKVNEIAIEYLSGKTYTEIAKLKGIKRSEVEAYVEEWKSLASNNRAIRQRAQDALAGADLHFTSLIAKAYEVMDEASLTSNLNAKTNSIKLILDIEARRIELLQKAGLLNNKELAESLVEMETKQEAFKQILQKVLCPSCKEKTLHAMQEATREQVIISVD